MEADCASAQTLYEGNRRKKFWSQGHFGSVIGSRPDWGPSEELAGRPAKNVGSPACSTNSAVLESPSVTLRKDPRPDRSRLGRESA